ERVAAVDRRDRELRRVGEAVDDQRLGVRLEGLENRVRRDELPPGAEVELALGRARRARVEGGDLPRHGALEQKGEPDRDPELGPKLVRELEALEPEHAVARRP